MTRELVLSQILSSECNSVVTHKEENKQESEEKLKKALSKVVEREGNFDKGFFTTTGWHHFTVFTTVGNYSRMMS